MIRSHLLRPSLHHFLSPRLLGTAAPRGVAQEGLPSAPLLAQPQGPPLPDLLTFEDPGAFRVKSLAELARALGVFRLCSSTLLVNNCGKVRR